jgi:UDP-N-acetylglucosamine/UDP-N-acetylgalactosamine 4-epimerase
VNAFPDFLERALQTAVSKYEQTKRHLTGQQYRWLVTGAAGFIGSNLVEALLALNQKVVGLDDFSTGYRSNLEQVRDAVGPSAWYNFTFIEANICRLEDCRRAVKGVDFVLHHAALGSVPRSLEEPILTNAANVSGFLNMLVASRDVGIKRFVYAASSSTYGDHPGLPKFEDVIGKPLSPYAVTKYVNELYADVFARCYGLQSIGLRYFNIFGPRQDPEGAYAAVIPKWVASLLAGEPVLINGDGETSRDFCYVENAVQANLLAALVEESGAINQVYNIAVNERTTLNQLFDMQRTLLTLRFPHIAVVRPNYRAFREGDVRHSQADISKAIRLLGYAPTHKIDEGLRTAMDWYVQHLIKDALPSR